MKVAQRTFIPGDRWIYFKIYTGVKIADNILIKDISRIIYTLKKEQAVDKWFFIRYTDPDFHIRIRILVKELSDIGRIIDLFYHQFQYLVKSNQIWKIQLDTYNRELERYGDTLIEEAESLFHCDSECILSVLKLLDKFKDENYRWMIALYIIDDLLSDFSLDLLHKQELLKGMSDSFKAEFGFNKFNSKQFNSKYRENRKIIESVLNGTIDDCNFIFLTSPLKKKAKKIEPVIFLIKEKVGSSKSDKDLSSLLSSYIHMSLNRLFRSKNRVHELIIYDFIYRYYTSKIARNKNITI